MSNKSTIPYKILIDFTQMKNFWKDPAVYKQGSGIYITDVDGKQYIDGMAGIFAVNSGYGNQDIVKAIKKQLDSLNFQNPLGATNNVALELVDVLGEIMPEGLKSVKPLNSGSEAIESAMKMARQYYKLTGKPDKFKFISRYGSWHGSTFGVLSISGYRKNKVPFEPLLQGCLHVLPPYCYQCPYSQSFPGCNVLCARILEKIIASEGPETVAGVVISPVDIRGVITAPFGYFKIIREICDRFDVMLILDEVITGFGRLGRMFGFELYDVVPDMLCLAKAISGGYGPASAMIARDKIAEVFWNNEEEDSAFKNGHTFGGNPISSAAVIANIRYIQKHDLPGRANQLGQIVKKRLEELKKYPIVGDVRGEGLLWGIEFVADRETRKPFDSSIAPGIKIKKACRDRGLLIRAENDWLAFGPPLVILDSELDKLLQILEESIAAVSREIA